MKRSLIKEKIKRSLCLFFSAIMILTLAFSTGNTFADTQGNATTAKQKAYYYALKWCFDRDYNLSTDADGSSDMTNQRLKEGKLFDEGLIGIGAGFGVSTIVEKGVADRYNDGSIKCGENGNNLIKKAITVLGIDDIKNLVCDYSHPNVGGLYEPLNSNGTCSAELGASTLTLFRPKSKNDRLSYLENLVKAKTGLNDLDNLTDLEEYYIYSNTFMTACATDQSTAYLDNPDQYAYQVVIYNTTTSLFQRGGFSGTSNTNKAIYVFGETQKTCGEIATALDQGGSVYEKNKGTLQSLMNSGANPLDYGIITQESAASVDDTNDDICYDKAGAIGWILCPVISSAKDLLESTYETVEKEYLQIDALRLFNTPAKNSGDSNHSDEPILHIVWSSFRDIANMGLALFLLFVILSQVTGYGIDNYGIKKALPRIIMIGIILNLSYIICEICVDLSNIIGIGIKDIFSGLTSKVTINTVAATGTSGAQSTLVMGGLLAIGIGVLFISPGLILTLALFLISMVISVLFLWVILICRQAGLILAIGISPVAFLCYIFPNTEKLFKRWTSLMKGLLLLYPICTFVISGGMLAGKIFAAMNTSTGNDATSRGLTLAAMIVPVIPYFFIPTLLRQSINAMGKLGATISHLGRALNQGTVGRFARSDTAKRMRTSMNSWDAGGLRSRISATKFGKYTGLQQSTARKIAAREKMKSDDRAAQALLQREKFARMEQHNPNNVSLQAFEAQLDAATNSVNGGDRYDAILSEIERRFGSSKAADLAMKTIDKNQNSALLSGKNRQEFMRKLAQNHQGAFSKTPDFAKYLQYGGVHRNSVTGATTHTSFNGTNVDGSHNFLTQDVNIGDFKDNQITAGNSNSIHRMIAAGKITQADASRIMANDDIRGSMDSVQQAILAASYDRNGAIGSAMTLPKAEVEAAFAGQTTYRDEAGAVHPVRITQAQANALVQ